MSNQVDATSEPSPAAHQRRDDEVRAERSAVEPEVAEALDGVEAEVEETVDGVPVLVQARPLAVAPPTLPAVQAAAVAATSFVAGAATLALVRRHSARKMARRSVSRRAVDALPIIGSRSFIVDVHLLAKPGE